MATVRFAEFFKWDADKAASNATKHGVTVEDAADALDDPLSVEFADAADPDRLVTLGECVRTGVLYVVSYERGDRVRIISARPAERHERRPHEDGDG